MTNDRDTDSSHPNDLWCTWILMLGYFICASGNLISFLCVLFYMMLIEVWSQNRSITKVQDELLHGQINFKLRLIDPVWGTPSREGTQGQIK